MYALHTKPTCSKALKGVTVSIVVFSIPLFKTVLKHVTVVGHRWKMGRSCLFQGTHGMLCRTLELVEASAS